VIRTARGARYTVRSGAMKSAENMQNSAAPERSAASAAAPRGRGNEAAPKTEEM